MNGICAEGEDGQDNFCICHTGDSFLQTRKKPRENSTSFFSISGWKGEACDQCVPYWDCPNKAADACNLPNECFCAPGTEDPEGLCQNEFLNQSGGTVADGAKKKK